MVRASRTITIKLESELLAILGGDAKARIVARYCGLDGLGGTTLLSAGREFGGSGERARQIFSEAAKRLCDSQPITPVLDRTPVPVPAIGSPGCHLWKDQRLFAGFRACRGRNRC